MRWTHGSKSSERPRTEDVALPRIWTQPGFGPADDSSLTVHHNQQQQQMSRQQERQEQQRVRVQRKTTMAVVWIVVMGAACAAYCALKTAATAAAQQRRQEQRDALFTMVIASALILMIGVLAAYITTFQAQPPQGRLKTLRCVVVVLIISASAVYAFKLHEHQQLLLRQQELSSYTRVVEFVSTAQNQLSDLVYRVSAQSKFPDLQRLMGAPRAGGVHGGRGGGIGVVEGGGGMSSFTGELVGRAVEGAIEGWMDGTLAVVGSAVGAGIVLHLCFLCFLPVCFCLVPLCICFFPFCFCLLPFRFLGLARRANV